MSEPSREAMDAARRAFPGLTCDGTGAEHEPFSSKRCGLCWTALTLDAFAAARVRVAYVRASERMACNEDVERCIALAREGRTA